MYLEMRIDNLLKLGKKQTNMELKIGKVTSKKCNMLAGIIMAINLIWFEIKNNKLEI